VWRKILQEKEDEKWYGHKCHYGEECDSECACNEHDEDRSLLAPLDFND